MDDKSFDINALLQSAFKPQNLRSIFEKRIHELNLSETGASKLINIERRTLKGILDGTQKKADSSSLQSLAAFLNMNVDELVEIHAETSKDFFSTEDTAVNKKRFIKENFDLAVLRKAGFINSITDFAHIEDRINNFFGFNSIFEYKKREFSAAFSAGAIIPKNTNARSMWLGAARDLAIKIDNPYNYERQALVNYFPQIRWYTKNTEFGFINVIKALYKIGITVIFMPRFSSLHLRGATMFVNNKPCIVITDYKGFYPTLWHCLIHELYHVLFDMDAIENNTYSCLISEDTDHVLNIDEREEEADEFARKYLFSEEKMDEVIPFIWDKKFVTEIADENNVHPSIIYIYYAYENDDKDRMAWARARRFMPDVNKAIFRLNNPWESPMPINEFVKKLKLEIYN